MPATSHRIKQKLLPGGNGLLLACFSALVFVIFGGVARAAEQDKSRVLIVHHPQATEAFSPQRQYIKQMLYEGLAEFTRRKTLKEAWLSLVRTNDVIGIKVHSAPGANSGTRPALVAEIIESLLEAGVPANNLVLWDRRLTDLRAAGFLALAERYGIRSAGSLEAGYDPEVSYENNLLGRLVYGDYEFGKRGEEVGRRSFVSRLVTQELTRIINVTPLLNHNLAGISGSMYGLAFGSIDNVLRFELDPERMATAIPEIYAMPEVCDRVALNIVDALICQYQGEERSLLHYSTALNELWFSHDPVALDVLGLEALDAQRKRTGITPPKVNRQIYGNAELMDLGKANLREIKPERLRIE